MFTDLSGSTALSTRLGPARTDALVQAHFDTVRRVLAEYGGEEVKTLGDGVMAVFGGVTGAVDCAVALQQAVEKANRARPDVADLRVGLSVGELNCQDGDYFGTPVVEAARLCAAAEPKQILASAVVKRLVDAGRAHVFRTLESRALKGLPGPFELDEVAWVPFVDRGLESDFTRRDEGITAVAISALAEMREIDGIVAQVVPRIAATLSPQPGERVLDVGCGIGFDVVELAAAVGATGLVIGVDHNRGLLEEASRRADAAGATNVEFRVGDATALPLEDDSVDACRSDRVLQYIVDPLNAVTEMVRVTRPGGRVVVADTDWETSVTNHDDLELSTRIQQAWISTRPSGRVGRQLPGLLRRAGLVDVTVEPVTNVTREYSEFHRTSITPIFASQAVTSGAVSEEEASRWIAALDAIAAEGRFLRALTMFVAAGRVPD